VNAKRQINLDKYVRKIFSFKAISFFENTRGIGCGGMVKMKPHAQRDVVLSVEGMDARVSF
jgi:hypothetical protein